MSGIVVVFQRDGTPMERTIAQQMLNTVSHRGPDGCALSFFPAAAVGHQHFWTTPEEVGECQPVQDRTGRYVLALDGRLDNRDELLAALACSDPHISDAALILLAYARWGDACFARLVGPFATVLLDTVQCRVLCARDALGDRTLFYYINSHVCLVASEEQALLTHPVVTERLNEAWLASYFALDVPSDGATFFADISELLPAHVMAIDEDTLRIWRHWEANPRAEIHYQSDQDYADHFRSLLEQSVSCRQRSPTVPMVMMSGGLDSTSVAALVARHLSGTHRHPPVGALSFVFDELSSCDERAFIATMYDRYPINGVQVPGDDAWPLGRLDNWPVNPNTPENNPYRWLKERMYVAAQQHGSRVILTGLFADELYSGAAYWLRDLLHACLFEQARREIWWHLGKREWRRFLLTSIVRCLPGEYELSRSRQLRHRSWLTTHARSCLSPDDEWTGRVRSALRPSQFDTLLGCYSARDSTGEIYHASRCGVELRHPYRDRRLVEFMLAIPAAQFYWRGQYKHVARNAMRGILPEPIHTRHSPTSLTPLFVRGLAERARETVVDLLYGADRMWPRYVRTDWLTQAMPGHRRSEAEELVLWSCLCLELWCRHRAGHV